jgi:hypothetical protein
MDIFYGIDGTGPDDNGEYKSAFATSHVRKFWQNWHSPAAGYIRGPSTFGTETGSRVSEGVRWTTQKYHEFEKLCAASDTYGNTKPRIFLSGYSRGGAAIISMAHKLKAKGIPVHAMLIFDAVDRSGLTDTDVIPDNVKMAFHALRDPAAGSRESFGNTGRKHKPGVAYEEKFFFCTHGGVGGTPWTKNGDSGKIEEMSTGAKVGAFIVGGIAGKMLADKHDFTNVTVAQDKQGSDASWAWMSKNLSLARASEETAMIGPIGSVGKTFQV